MLKSSVLVQPAVVIVDGGLAQACTVEGQTVCVGSLWGVRSKRLLMEVDEGVSPTSSPKSRARIVRSGISKRMVRDHIFSKFAAAGAEVSKQAGVKGLETVGATGSRLSNPFPLNSVECARRLEFGVRYLLTKRRSLSGLVKRGRHEGAHLDDPSLAGLLTAHPVASW